MDMIDKINVFYKKASDNIYYHASPFSGINKDFSNFTGHKGLLFLTKNRSDAIEYSKGKLGFSARFEGENNPTLYTVVIAPNSKIFDLRKEQDRLFYNAARNVSAEVDPEDPLPKLENKNFIHSHTGLPSWQSISQIKPYIEIEYDGMFVTETGISTSLAIFNPSKSARIVSEESL